MSVIVTYTPYLPCLRRYLLTPVSYIGRDFLPQHYSEPDHHPVPARCQPYPHNWTYAAHSILAYTRKYLEIALPASCTRRLASRFPCVLHMARAAIAAREPVMLAGVAEEDGRVLGVRVAADMGP